VHRAISGKPFCNTPRTAREVAVRCFKPVLRFRFARDKLFFMPNNYILIPVGSSGDVHPLVGVAIALKVRGHRVTVCTNGYFRELVERNGLEYVEFGTREEYLKVIDDPDIWHPRRGTQRVMTNLIEKMLHASYEWLVERWSREKFTLIASPLCMGARLAHETHAIPLISTHLQPLVMRSAHEIPALPGVWLPKWTPAFAMRALYSFADRFFIDPILCPPLNRLRAQLKLPPVKRPMAGWWNSPQCIVGLWPEWFGPPQPDWPATLRAVGFPLYDEQTVTALSPEVEKFLAAGTPPIAFTPGSAMRQGLPFFSAAIEGCKALNRRGILLTRFKENIPPKLTESVIHVEFAPFGQLLPRCAALVHHGGIGTMAQGFQAGIPQLTMPMAHDQPDNARRLKELGCGDALPPKKFTGPAIAEKMRPLLESADVKKGCAAVRERIDPAAALALACAVIEEHTPPAA
jgi:rhamnosyltransferase subunit B